MSKRKAESQNLKCAKGTLCYQIINVSYTTLILTYRYTAMKSNFRNTGCFYHASIQPFNLLLTAKITRFLDHPLYFEVFIYINIFKNKFHWWVNFIKLPDMIHCSLTKDLLLLFFINAVNKNNFRSINT